MDEFLHRVVQNIAGRIHGPMNFRFVVQPLMALLIAIRAGRRDARSGDRPYMSAVFGSDTDSRALLKQGWRDVRTVFIIATLLDVIYQITVLNWVYPGEVLLVATCLALVPYLIFRGMVTRIVRRIVERDRERARTTRP
jgi:hypothetical protein